MDNGKKGFKGRGVVHEHYIYGVVHWHTIKYDVVHEYYNGVVHFRNKIKVFTTHQILLMFTKPELFFFFLFFFYKWLKKLFGGKKDDCKISGIKCMQKAHAALIQHCVK